MITHSEQITNLASALLKAQRDIGAATKGAKNPFFKSSYADLGAVIEAIKEPLNRNGITFLQAVDSFPQASDHGDAVIDTILLHESGQYLSTRTPIFCAKPNDPQAFGSGVTYSKRYALQALLGLPTADDDGEGAMGRQGNGNVSKRSKAKPTEVRAELYAKYIEEHASDIAEHFYLPQDVFDKLLNAEVKKRYPTPEEKRGLACTVENLMPIVEAAVTPKLAEILVEEK